MKLLLVTLAAVLMLTGVAVMQTDSMVIDTTMVTPSPIDFNKVLNIDSIAHFFGADPALFVIFVAMIFVLTEFTKTKVKAKGELFFVDNKSIPLPFIVGVSLAFIAPTGFGFWESIRFGLQGAVAATIVYMLGSFVWGASSRRNT